ncbi:hypothetical protein [Amycolatopsis samaneae]|uniref:Uncharacterized protein n=1 Tax=Amycolatopsis samaneae TaxID=664691 RepID=A0ABW5GCX7_9PSEU
MATEDLMHDAGGVKSRNPSSVRNFLSFLGVGKSRPERAYELNNNDWASEIPGPDLSKADFYSVLGKVPLIYRQAMDDLARTPLDAADDEAAASS